MRPDDDGLCWLCDNPLAADRSATSWHGFGAHRECARQEGARAPMDGLDKDGLDNDDVIGTNT